MGFWSNIREYLPAFAGGTFYSIRDPQLRDVFRGAGKLTPTLISLGSSTEIAAAWEQCPPIVSIICGKALADITGKVTFTYAESGEEVNLSKQLTARAMHKLMMRPNPLQTWRQFRAQQKVYVQLFGFCPVLTIKPAGFTGPDSVKAMWNLPPQHLTIHTSGKLYYQSDSKGIITRVEIKSEGQSKDLPVEDIFFLRDQYASLWQEAIPTSRISALTWPISNIIQAYKGANVLITKRGALGILSGKRDASGAMPVLPQHKLALQEDWRNYGLDPDLSQIIITESSVEWQQISLPVKDLMLYEAIDDGTRQCCAVFNYPYEMLPTPDGVTFENRKEAKKSLYQDAIIPEADSDMEVYNEFFKLAEKGIVMSLSYEHLEVFQVSETDKAAALKGKAEAAGLMFKSEAITLRRMREMLGEETTTDDDVYYSEWQKANAPEPDNQNVNQDEPTI